MKEICSFCGKELEIIEKPAIGWATDKDYDKVCKNPNCPKGKADLARIERSDK